MTHRGRCLGFMLLGGILGSILTLVVVVEERSHGSASQRTSQGPTSDGGPDGRVPELQTVRRAAPRPSVPEEVPSEAKGASVTHAPPKIVIMRTDEVPEPPPDAVAVEELLPPALTKARLIDQKYEIFGDRSKYGYRVQLHDWRGYAFARSGLKRQPGRTTPDTWVPFVLQIAGVEATQEEMTQYIQRGWGLWEEESRLVGELARRTQSIINRKMAAGKHERGLAAIELREGKVYIVRSADDIDVRTLMETIRGLEERRRGFARRIASER